MDGTGTGHLFDEGLLRYTVVFKIKDNTSYLWVTTAAFIADLD
jgi:hypothetical protein